jgi:hypothetical protein
MDEELTEKLLAIAEGELTDFEESRSVFQRAEMVFRGRERFIRNLEYEQECERLLLDRAKRTFLGIDRAYKTSPGRREICLKRQKFFSA